MDGSAEVATRVSILVFLVCLLLAHGLFDLAIQRRKSLTLSFAVVRLLVLKVLLDPPASAGHRRSRHEAGCVRAEDTGTHYVLT